MRVEQTRCTSVMNKRGLPDGAASKLNNKDGGDD
jgi:hypothetical protein